MNQTTERQDVELAHQVHGRARRPTASSVDHRLIYTRSRGALFEPIRPVVVGRAAAARRLNGRTSPAFALGAAQTHTLPGGPVAGPIRIRLGVARRVGDDVGDRDAGRVVNLVRHLVAGSELAPGQCPATTISDRFGNPACPPACEDLVDEVERGDRRVVVDMPPPRQIRPQRPDHFVRGDVSRQPRVSSGKAGGDHDRVVERPGEKLAAVDVLK